MPTYEIAGKRVQTEAPLSDAEIDEIAASISGNAPQAAQPVAQQAVPQPAEPARQATSAEALAGIPTDHPISPVIRPKNRVDNPNWVEAGLQGVGGAGIGIGVVKGLELATRGSRIAPYTATLAANVIPRSGSQLMLEGAAGGAGGIVGRLFGQNFMPGWQRDLAEVAGGVVGGALVSPFAGVNKIMAEGITGLMGQSSAVMRETAETLGSNRALSAAKTALDANKNLGDDVLRAGEIRDKTGIHLPTLAAANGDTTISGYLQREIAKGENATFTAEQRQMYLDAEKQLAAAKPGVAPSMEEVDALVKQRAQATAKINKARETQVAMEQSGRDAAIKQLDARIVQATAELHNPDAAGRFDIGTRVTKFVDAKEEAVQGKLSPEYDKVIEGAMAQGITLPGSAAAAIREYATDEMNKEVFHTFPKLHSLIKDIFKAKPQDPTKSLVIADRYGNVAPTAKGDVTENMPLTHLDSLKREVNAALRKAQRANDHDKQHILGELKDRVNAAIDQTDPRFRDSYKAIDQRYYEEMGIPFRNAEGILQVNHAKFVEQTVPVLTSKKSSLDDFLRVAGDDPEGLKIVEDAFMFKLASQAGLWKKLPEGGVEMKPAAVKWWIQQHREQIDSVPGLRQKLEAQVNDVDNLLQTRSRILAESDAAKVERVENLWTQAYGTSGGMQRIVGNAFNNQQQMDNLLTLVSNDPVALDGVKAGVLEHLTTMQGDRVAAFKAQEANIARIFGKQQAEHLGLIVEASQRLKDNPLTFRLNPERHSEDPLKKGTGTSVAQSAGELRAVVMTKARVAFNHVSRYFMNEADKAESAAMQHLLRNPKFLEDTALMLKEYNDKGITGKGIALASKWMGNWAINAGLGAAGGAAQQNDRETPSKFLPMDPTLLDGFIGNDPAPVQSAPQPAPQQAPVQTTRGMMQTPDGPIPIPPASFAPSVPKEVRVAEQDNMRVQPATQKFRNGDQLAILQAELSREKDPKVKEMIRREIALVSKQKR